MNSRTRVAAFGIALSIAAALTGCDAIAPPKKPAIGFESNVSAGQTDVTVDTLVRVSATQGTLTKASLKSAKATVPIAQQGDAWVATSRLEPGTDYVLTATGTGEDGSTETLKRSFRTQALTLNEQT